MTRKNLNETFTRIYTDLLKSVALEDPVLEDILTDITLGETLATHFPRRDDKTGLADIERLSGVDDEAGGSKLNGYLTSADLVTYGAPVRRHLDSSTRKRLLEQVTVTLREISECFGEGEASSMSRLPENIQAFKDNVDAIQREITELSLHLLQSLDDLVKFQKEFDGELGHLMSATLPAYNAARASSVDLLAASIEASLQKLNLIRGQSQRGLYHHLYKQDSSDTSTMLEAITASSAWLEEEEKRLKNEALTLNFQLQEYETLLQLVGGDNGGYQQIIDDWTKTQQETGECLKDLRRLGWTGD